MGFLTYECFIDLGGGKVQMDFPTKTGEPGSIECVLNTLKTFTLKTQL